MNQTDWLEYFEAVNGRPATQDEIAAALAAGEFEAEPVATNQVFDVADEPVVAHTQANAQTNINQNQQSQGMPQMQQAQVPPVQNVPNPTVEQFKSSSKNFASWLMTALKSPNLGDTSKFNGVISLGIVSVLLAATFFTTADKTLKTVTANDNVNSTINAITSIANLFGVNNSVLTSADGAFNTTMDAGKFLRLLLGVAVVVFAIGLAYFISRRFIYQTKEEPFLNGVSQFGHITALAVPLSLLAFIFAVMEFDGGTITSVVLTFIVLSLGSIFSLQYNKANMDRFYSFLLSAIITAVTIVVSVLLMSVIIGDELKTILAAKIGSLIMNWLL